MSLVSIPWQPNLFLTPDTLALLVAAGNVRGKPLHVVGNDGAWRAYAKQKYFYDGWVARKPGFNPASNPDTGQRSHMRGAAFDLINTDAATQAACRAVGLIRDPAEPWHWNNPRWASMPIIKANTGTAGSNTVPIAPVQEEEDEDMPRIIYHVQRGYAQILPYGHIRIPETQDGNNQVAAILNVAAPKVGTWTPDGVKRYATAGEFDAATRSADQCLAALLGQIKAATR
jgi:hypothetical protein